MTLRTDPFLAFRFELRLDDLPAAGFTEIAGLGLQTDVQDYAEGGLIGAIHRFPGQTRQSNLTLKRGLVDRRLWDWYFKLTQGRMRYRSGSVVVLSPAGESTMEIQFYRAFPVKWSGPDLNAGQSQIAVETLELAHGGLTWT